MARWLFLILLAGCGPAVEPVADASIDSGAELVDAGIVDAGAPDAGAADAGTPDAGRPGFQVPSCAGSSLPMRGSGRIPYVDATLGTETRAFLVDFASTSSWVDLAVFSSGSWQSCSSSTCTWAAFDYFGAWGQVTLNTADFSGFPGPPRQAGIIGTDFLSVKPTTLDYRGKRVLSASASTFCTPAQLVDAGFVELSSSGFYSTRLSSLVPLSSVVNGAAAGLTVPNVPTIQLRLSGVTALAQLDTGFDDVVVRNSININAAFLNALLNGAPGTLVRESALDLTLTTCAGVAEPVTAWRVASGHQLEFVAPDGGVARVAPSAVLFAKDTPPAARVCGGIGTWSVNAAQVAGSFFVDAEAVVFDPVRSAVWMPR